MARFKRYEQIETVTEYEVKVSDLNKKKIIIK